jgi:hypothetical protein
MPIDPQDPTQDQGQNPADLLAQLFGPGAGPPSPSQPNPLAQLVGLVAQARQQGAPVQQAPLPQVLGPAGTPSQPYQPAQPERPQPQSISDFLPDQTRNTTANNASSASVIHEGEKRQSKLPQTVGDFNTAFSTPGNQYYVSPAKRVLQNFMIGLAAMGGHTGFETSRQQKYEEWQTDLKTDLANQSKWIQRTKESDLQQSRQARLAFNDQKEQDAKTLSEKKYQLTYHHTQTQERQADQKIALATQAEKDRVAGKQQSNAIAAMGPAMRAAKAYVELQHRNAGDDLSDPAIQNQMNVEIADRIDEEQPRVHSDMLFTKLGASGALDGVDVTNQRQMLKAISDADLAPEDKSFLKGYVASHPTPATTTEGGIKRMQALGNTKELGAIDSNTGQVRFATPGQIQQNPAIVPAGPATSSMSKQATFVELHRAVNQAKAAWGNIKAPITPQARVMLSRISSTGDSGVISTLLTPPFLGSLSPEEQDLVMTTGALKENALSMRSVAGMGQGSESTRNAVDAILPNGKTPDPAYALKQLGLLENQIGTLESGVPGVGKVTERQKSLEAPTPTENPQAPPRAGSSTPTVQWRRNKKTGEIQSSQDGGKTWLKRNAPQQ